MKSALGIAGLMLLGWSGIALAQATTISTPCPVSFQCAFSAAEAAPLSPPTGQNPGQPNAFLGYLSFDSSGNPSMTGVQNLNGTVTTITSATGTCTAGSGGGPGLLTFNSSTVLSFVSDSQGGGSLTSPLELKFILSATNGKGTIPIRVGTCTKL